MSILRSIKVYDRVRQLANALARGTNSLLLWLTLLNVIAILYDLGYEQPDRWRDYFLIIHTASIALFILAFAGKVIVTKVLRTSRLTLTPADYAISVLVLFFLLFSVFIIFSPREQVWYQVRTEYFWIIRLMLFVLFFAELSRVFLSLSKLLKNTPLVFALSFLLMIGLGGIMLLSPNATTDKISITDALFTATSAVCVTGLTVLDTATDFTYLGKAVIIVLIQIGGLGFMTITSFLGFLFQGTTFREALLLKELLNQENLGTITSTLVKIIVFTLLAELLGSAWIYFTLDGGMFETTWGQIRFSLFHGISAFCNAGFSTLSNGLYEAPVRFNYALHFIVALLIIVGGIGFPVIIDIYYYVKSRILAASPWSGPDGPFVPRRQLSVHTRVVIFTTLVLLLFGFCSYLLTEQQATLKGLSPTGAMVTSFFGAVTPRTAGFNTVDMQMLASPTILVFILLMWIGASPGSTGGGLKTTTFTVAFLNVIDVARNKSRLELMGREINIESLRRAFAVVLLSQVVIGIGVISISVLHPELPFTAILFECFSAFSTVGLTLGLTWKLGFGAKWILMALMFLGRVGTLTVLFALVRKVTFQRYRYPKEDVFIL